MMTRRQALRTVALSSAACASFRSTLSASAQDAPPPLPVPPPVVSGPFRLPPLPYAVDALEPYFDARTMEIHHGKHHAGYVGNLNRAVTEFADLKTQTPEALVRALGRLPEKVRTAVRNHGGGHVNHSFFWPLLKKNHGQVAGGELGRAIDQRFGSFAAFRDEFTQAASTLFGSGWAWLTVDARRELRVETTPNQDSPLTAGRTPVVGLDVWEHAYYLKYQNRRADYIAAFFSVIDWDRAAANFKPAAA